MPAAIPLVPVLSWLTLLLAGLVLFGGLGHMPLSSLNEARRALPVKAIIEQGDWLIPHIQQAIYLAKPPLLYWLAALFSETTGSVSEWTVRLPSALAAAITACILYRYAKKTFGSWSALFAVQALIANVSFAMFARRAELEMLLTLLCVAALLAAIRFLQEGSSRIWIYLSYLMLALAMLTKGPVVLLLVTLPLLVTACLTHDRKCWEILGSPAGWGLFFLIGGSWYAAVSWQLGLHVWQGIAHRDLLEKMVGEFPKPWYSYLGWICADFLPWSLLAAMAFRKVKAFFNGSTERWLIGMSVLVPLVVFSLFSNKHDKYLLPMYPWIALVIGAALGEGFHAMKAWMRGAVIAVGIALLASYSVYYLWMEAAVFNYRYAMLQPFAEWTRSMGGAHLYAYKEVDPRLLYYAARPIQPMDGAQLKRLPRQGIVLLVEKRDAVEAESLGYCPQGVFRPYLTRKNALYVMEGAEGGVCRHRLDTAPGFNRRRD